MTLSPFLSAPLQGNWQFQADHLKAYHQPNAIPDVLCLPEERTGQLKMTKA